MLHSLSNSHSICHVLSWWEPKTQVLYASHIQYFHFLVCISSISPSLILCKIPKPFGFQFTSGAPNFTSNLQISTELNCNYGSSSWRMVQADACNHQMVSHCRCRHQYRLLPRCMSLSLKVSIFLQIFGSMQMGFVRFQLGFVCTLGISWI